jgi:hypothetical protein
VPASGRRQPGPRRRGDRRRARDESLCGCGLFRRQPGNRGAHRPPRRAVREADRAVRRGSPVRREPAHRAPGA